MPELPEVETVRRGLQPAMEGARIERLELRRPDLRFPFPQDFAAAVEGQTVLSLGRRAKYLLADLSNGLVVIMHLGMSGSFRIVDGGGEDMPGAFHHERSRLLAHDHAIFHLSTPQGEGCQVRYNDPRRFGFMLMTERSSLPDHPLMKGLGAEPVGNDLSAELLAGKLHNRTMPLKAALLDQRIIAGLGNIYVCEALWRTGLSPRRKAASLVKKSGAPTRRLELLTDNIRAVIAEAIAAGGSSLRDHARTDGTLGYFQHSFAAYDREGEPCRNEDCGRPIRRIVQSGRSTFYCPDCQR